MPNERFFAKLTIKPPGNWISVRDHKAKSHAVRKSVGVKRGYDRQGGVKKVKVQVKSG